MTGQGIRGTYWRPPSRSDRGGAPPDVRRSPPRRLALTRQLIDEVMAEAHGRMLGDGIWYPDLREILERVQHWDEWYDVWAAFGDRYERLGDEALGRGWKVSAGEYYWRACMHYHYGQFLYFRFPEKREAGQRRKQELYRNAAPLLVPPAERVEIPIDETSIPGCLRLPPGIAKAPCAILIGGLESTKEESYGFENLLLRRGVATLAFDGPGQGEMWMADWLAHHLGAQ